LSSGRFPDEWHNHLKESMSSDSFKELKRFILQERKERTVFPPSEDIFNAFIYTPLEKIKVVILGQDPYHNYNQAHGLAFSVRDGIKVPPSLQNIYVELQHDLGLNIPDSGNLQKWAERGVFLLNTVLTVRKGEANSHRGRGWEEFTDSVIETISQERSGVVFILWGKPAQSKEKLIDSSKHLILKAPHPSPLSAYRGFFGSKPFSRTNGYLKSIGKTAINWQL